MFVFLDTSTSPVCARWWHKPSTETYPCAITIANKINAIVALVHIRVLGQSLEPRHVFNLPTETVPAVNIMEA
jgi:hypothetical protein